MVWQHGPFLSFHKCRNGSIDRSWLIFLLLLGLGTRLISIPLMMVWQVAIFTVHIGDGFEASNNGFEIPLYYFIMLITLFFYGGEKISADFMVNRATLARFL
jgi:putative oxidoreductase